MLVRTGWMRDPWSLLDEFESLHEDVNRAVAGRGGWGVGAFPAVNVWTSDEGIAVDAELPGVAPKAVEVSLTGSELTISGRLDDGVPEGSAAVVRRRERPCGEFARRIELPFGVDQGKVKAAYKNGILRIRVPKAEEEKPRKIAIEA